jgi:hypothetical protein
MPIKLPDAPIPVEHQALTYRQIGHRWKTRSSIAKGTLQKAGVPTIYVPQQPAEGVRLTDLLKFEANLRKKKEGMSSISINPPQEYQPSCEANYRSGNTL